MSSAPPPPSTVPLSRSSSSASSSSPFPSTPTSAHARHPSNTVIDMSASSSSSVSSSPAWDRSMPPGGLAAGTSTAAAHQSHPGLPPHVSDALQRASAIAAHARAAAANVMGTSTPPVSPSSQATTGVGASYESGAAASTPPLPVSSSSAMSAAMARSKVQQIQMQLQMQLSQPVRAGPPPPIALPTEEPAFESPVMSTLVGNGDTAVASRPPPPPATGVTTTATPMAATATATAGTGGFVGARGTSPYTAAAPFQASASATTSNGVYPPAAIAATSTPSASSSTPMSERELAFELGGLTIEPYHATPSIADTPPAPALSGGYARSSLMAGAPVVTTSTSTGSPLRTARLPSLSPATASTTSSAAAGAGVLGTSPRASAGLLHAAALASAMSAAGIAPPAPLLGTPASMAMTSNTSSGSSGNGGSPPAIRGSTASMLASLAPISTGAYTGTGTLPASPRTPRGSFTFGSAGGKPYASAPSLVGTKYVSGSTTTTAGGMPMSPGLPPPSMAFYGAATGGAGVSTDATALAAAAAATAATGARASPLATATSLDSGLHQRRRSMRQSALHAPGAGQPSMPAGGSAAATSTARPDDPARMARGRSPYGSSRIPVPVATGSGGASGSASAPGSRPGSAAAARPPVMSPQEQQQQLLRRGASPNSAARAAAATSSASSSRPGSARPTMRPKSGAGVTVDPAAPSTSATATAGSSAAGTGDASKDAPRKTRVPMQQLVFGGRRSDLRVGMANRGSTGVWSAVGSGQKRRKSLSGGVSGSLVTGATDMVRSGAAMREVGGGGGRTLADHRKSMVRRTRDSLLCRLTILLVDTYRTANPHFHYTQHQNPRRVLTKPSKPMRNDGHDNEDNDYILYVNDTLGDDADRKYQIIDILGQGTFGQVVKCQHLKTQAIVAVKVIKNKPAYFNQSLMEVNVLEMLNAKFDKRDTHHIIRLHDSFVFRRHLCLVFEPLSINLYELIKQNQFRGLDLALVRSFTSQILDALACLGEAKMIHCDLKPENILLKGLHENQLKVIDFGSACQEHQTVYTYIQSRFYRSPEVLLGLPYTSAIDMWSLGCIVAELYLGLPLFPGTSEYNQISRIIDMLGNPPNYMIEVGKNAKSYFVKTSGEPALSTASPSRGGTRTTTASSAVYKFKSREQYSREHNTNEQPSKRYFAGTSLREVVMQYPMSRKLVGAELDEQIRQRECLVDFLRGTLHFNPIERWSAQQARMHPFITGATFRGAWQPGAIVPSSREGSTSSSSAAAAPGPRIVQQQQQQPPPPPPPLPKEAFPGMAATAGATETMPPSPPESSLSSSSQQQQQQQRAIRQRSKTLSSTTGGTAVSAALAGPMAALQHQQQQQQQRQQAAGSPSAASAYATQQQQQEAAAAMAAAQKRKSSIADLNASLQGRVRRGSSMEQVHTAAAASAALATASEQTATMSTGDLYAQYASMAAASAAGPMPPTATVMSAGTSGGAGGIHHYHSTASLFPTGPSSSSTASGGAGTLSASGSIKAQPMLRKGRSQSISSGAQPPSGNFNSVAAAVAAGVPWNVAAGGYYDPQTGMYYDPTGAASAAARGGQPSTMGAAGYSGSAQAPLPPLPPGAAGGVAAGGTGGYYGVGPVGQPMPAGAGALTVGGGVGSYHHLPGMPSWNPTHRVIPQHLELYTGGTTDEEDWREMDDAAAMGSSGILSTGGPMSGAVSPMHHGSAGSLAQQQQQASAMRRASLAAATMAAAASGALRAPPQGISAEMAATMGSPPMGPGASGSTERVYAPAQASPLRASSHGQLMTAAGYPQHQQQQYVGAAPADPAAVAYAQYQMQVQAQQQYQQQQQQYQQGHGQ